MLLMLLLYNSDSWLHLAAHRYLVWTPLTALEYSIYQEISFIWKDVRYFPFSLVPFKIVISTFTFCQSWICWFLISKEERREACVLPRHLDYTECQAFNQIQDTRILGSSPITLFPFEFKEIRKGQKKIIVFGISRNPSHRPL